MKCEILYEDGDILVIYKPAGLATQTGAVGQSDAVSELKNYLAKNAAPGKGPVKGGIYLGVVHRLDQPVEGLLVFAKTPKASATLTSQLSKGTLNKQYYAAVCGKPSRDEATLVDYLVKEGNAAKVVTGEEKKFPEAKKSILSYHVMKYQDLSDGKGISLVDVSIETGRFHQIRCQMAAAGTPLLGDQKYGDESSAIISRTLGIRNVALCAYKLQIKHPSTGKVLSWELPMEQCKAINSCGFEK